MTEEGAIYSFGSGGHGLLGHGDRVSLHSLKVADALRQVRIAAAAAGSHHFLALAADSMVSSWGNNNYGQLGIRHKSEYVVVPQTIDAMIRLQVGALAAGGRYSFAVTAAG